MAKPTIIHVTLPGGILPRFHLVRPANVYILSKKACFKVGKKRLTCGFNVNKVEEVSQIVVPFVELYIGEASHLQLVGQDRALRTMLNKLISHPGFSACKSFVIVSKVNDLLTLEERNASSGMTFYSLAMLGLVHPLIRFNRRTSGLSWPREK